MDIRASTEKLHDGNGIEGESKIRYRLKQPRGIFNLIIQLSPMQRRSRQPQAWPFMHVNIHTKQLELQHPSRYSVHTITDACKPGIQRSCAKCCLALRYLPYNCIRSPQLIKLIAIKINNNHPFAPLSIPPPTACARSAAFTRGCMCQMLLGSSPNSNLPSTPWTLGFLLHHCHSSSFQSW